MKSNFEKMTDELYERAIEFVDMATAVRLKENDKSVGIEVSEEYKRDFFAVIDKINFNLIEDEENFYGYFLLQMGREINFDISSPSGVNFKGSKYVIYFNPLLFLKLDIKQMETTIKHEILHIISMHLIRAKECKENGKYSTIAVNLAMDVVVNQYLNYLPPYSATLEWVNVNYSLQLEAYQTFEYYLDKIQNELDLQDENEDGEEHDTNIDEDEYVKYDQEKTHDIWDESDDIDEKTMTEFTQKFVNSSQKGTLPEYMKSFIAQFKNKNGELPWNLYLKKLMGTIESNKKKTVTRRNRRQPNRLDLRGELRSHKAEIAVAIDISGSISDEEFRQAIKEVLSIIKNHNHEITIIECDREIKRIYKVKNVRDVQDRVATGGGTEFSPVFEYLNAKKFNLLIYFTDGKGEKTLKSKPKGYKVLWVVSGKGDKLSLKNPYGAVKKLSKVEEKNKANMLDLKDVMYDGYSMNNQQPII